MSHSEGYVKFNQDLHNIAAASPGPAGVLVMTAHQDGVIAYGGSVEEAERILTTLYERLGQ